MPQSTYETCSVIRCNGSVAAPRYRHAGRAALGGKNVHEWIAMIGFDGQISDPDELADIQRRLGLPDRPDGAFTLKGKLHVVYYDA
jgi:hypothetical protein